MKQNNNQFDLHFQKLADLFEGAKKENNPGRYLFENGLRTPLLLVQEQNSLEECGTNLNNWRTCLGA